MLIEPLEPFTTQAAQALAGYVPAVGPYTEYVADALEVYAGYTVLSFVLKFVLQALLTATLGAASSIDTVGRNKYDLGSKLGGGSYGSVALDTTGSVVIKTSNRQPRAKDFAKAELEMNQKLKLCGQSGVMAAFEGHYTDDDANLNLVFKNEGTVTLDQAMRGGSFPWNVEYELLGSESDEQSLDRQAKLIRKITAQLFQNLAGIHSWSVVHRDVKGANLILAEKARRFKLLDFGAACDLFSGTNYNPKLQVFDPTYGPPECTVLQAQRGEGGLDKGAGGKFDVFSAGLVVVQMCFKAYRSDAGMQQFKRSLDACDYDLKKWREAAENRAENAEGFEILDKYGGFSLLQGCLKRNPNQRISAAAAASSRFCLFA